MLVGVVASFLAANEARKAAQQAREDTACLKALCGLPERSVDEVMQLAKEVANPYVALAGSLKASRPLYTDTTDEKALYSRVTYLGCQASKFALQHHLGKFGVLLRYSDRKREYLLEVEEQWAPEVYVFCPKSGVRLPVSDFDQVDVTGPLCQSVVPCFQPSHVLERRGIERRFDHYRKREDFVPYAEKAVLVGQVRLQNGELVMKKPATPHLPYALTTSVSDLQRVIQLSRASHRFRAVIHCGAFILAMGVTGFEVWAENRFLKRHRGDPPIPVF